MTVTKAGDSKVVAQSQNSSQATTDASNRLSQEANNTNQIGMTGLAGDADRVLHVTGKGLEDTPAGVVHAVSNEIHNPGELAKTIAGSALFGAALKTFLPEAGSVGTIAGLAMGGYFIGSSMPGFINAYGQGLDAKTKTQMDDAGKTWGDSAGQLGVNSLIGFGGYKIGAGAADSILSGEKFDNFADAKQNFWNGATDNVKGVLPDKVAGFLHIDKSVPTAVSLGMQPHYVADGDGAKLMDSERQKPNAEVVGEVDPEQPMSVDMYLKRNSSGLIQDRYNARVAAGKSAVLGDDDDAFAKKFGSSPESVNAVHDFAHTNNLEVGNVDLRSGKVTLNGRTGDFVKAFKMHSDGDVLLKKYRAEDGTTFQGREGALTLPKELASHVEAVLGNDDRSAAHSISRTMRPVATAGGAEAVADSHADANTNAGSGTGAGSGTDSGSGADDSPNAARQGYLATDVGQAQNFPLESGGAGQRGVFISAGGGVDLDDYNKFFPENGLEQPKPLGIILVDGAKNSFGDPNGADGENSLDGQQMQSLAPKATVDMILGNNDDKSFNNVFVRGVFPEGDEQQAGVINSSWGLNEGGQTQQAISRLHQTFRDAATRGVTVFAASGDAGADDGTPSVQVDYPASDPNVTGVGGLRMVLDGTNKVTSASAWNDGQQSSGGGGISRLFDLPTWQKGIVNIKNAATGKMGRGVPDISTNADPVTGFKVRVDGNNYVIGGTSAAAPTYAGLKLNLDSELAAKGIQPVPQLNPWMYARANDSNIFKDVVSGNNNGYSTSKGWDPVTGLGYVDGRAMLNAMIQNQTSDLKSATKFAPKGLNTQQNQKQSSG